MKRTANAFNLIIRPLSWLFLGGTGLIVVLEIIKLFVGGFVKTHIWAYRWNLPIGDSMPNQFLWFVYLVTDVWTDYNTTAMAWVIITMGLVVFLNFKEGYDIDKEREDLWKNNSSQKSGYLS